MSVTRTDSQISQATEFGLFSLVHGDPLGQLIGRFAIRSRYTAVSLAALLSFSAAIVAAFEGSLINDDLSLDLIHDIGWWNQFLLAFPALIYIQSSYFGAFPSTLKQLVDVGVLLADDKQWEKVRRFTNAKLTNKTLICLPYVFGITASVLAFNVTKTADSWYDLDQYVAGWLIPIHAFFLYYFMTYLALRVYTAFLILKTLFSFKTNIQPFHTDGCGGLRSLMTQAEKLYFGMIAFGFITALGILSNTIIYRVDLFSLSNILFIMSDVLLTSIAFFIPLYALSSCMMKAKQNILDTIRQRQNTLNFNQADETSANSEDKKIHAEDLAALETLKKIASSMQVWPFNRSSFIRFMFVVATPFLIIPFVLLFT